MSYLNSVTIIGFVGADPEQRQARNNNGSKFTVLSVATQRSWKNTDDEWASKTEWHRVCVRWNLAPLQTSRESLNHIGNCHEHPWLHMHVGMEFSVPEDARRTHSRPISCLCTIGNLRGIHDHVKRPSGNVTFVGHCEGHIQPILDHKNRSDNAGRNSSKSLLN
jgi:hypothetical protein